MTPAELKAKLRKEGKTLRELTKELNIDYRSAQGLLSGTQRGHRGKAHRAAVALGLKEAA